MSWDGKAVAGVDRASPLTRLVDVLTFRDGSTPGGGEHTAPGRMTSAPVTLERPVGGDTAFQDWAASASSVGTHKEVTVEVLDRDGAAVLAYRLHRLLGVGVPGVAARARSAGVRSRAAPPRKRRLGADLKRI